MTAQAPLDVAVHRAPTLLPEAPVGRTTGWWGMTLFIATESVTFAAFLASYFYLRFSSTGPWPPPTDSRPGLVYPSLASAVLVVSCLPMWTAVRATRTGRRGTGLLGVFLALLAGCAFLVLQVVDWAAEYPTSTPRKDAYGSLFYVITGLHAVHVLLGVGMLLFVFTSLSLKRIGAPNPEPVRLVANYWYSMAVLALTILLTVYISPYL